MSDKIINLKKTSLNLNILLFVSTQILLFTLFPVLSERQSLSLTFIAGSFSLGTFLFLWGAPFWSHQSDKIGKEAVMSVGLLGLALSFGLIVSLLALPQYFTGTPAMVILLLSRIIYGATASAIVPMGQMIRAEMGNKDGAMKAMFTHSLFLSLGRMLGPIILLLSMGHIEILLLSITAIAFILLTVNFIISNKETIAPSYKESTQVQNNWRTIAQEMSLPLLITILFTAYTGILHTSLGGLLQKTFFLTSIEASKFMAQVLLLGSIAMAIVQLLGRFLAKSEWRGTLSFGVVSLILGAGILAFMSATYQVWFAIVFISVGIALIHPSNITIVHQTSSSESMARKVGLLSSGNTIGYAIGGTLATLFLGFNIHFISFIVLMILLGVTVQTCRRIS